MYIISDSENETVRQVDNLDEFFDSLAQITVLQRLEIKGFYKDNRFRVIKDTNKVVLGSAPQHRPYFDLTEI